MFCCRLAAAYNREREKLARARGGAERQNVFFFITTPAAGKWATAEFCPQDKSVLDLKSFKFQRNVEWTLDFVSLLQFITKTRNARLFFFFFLFCTNGKTTRVCFARFYNHGVRVHAIALSINHAGHFMKTDVTREILIENVTRVHYVSDVFFPFAFG